ncbi:hypothetical protein Taro_019619 [Colocasia esculenta]|uniref:Uncharacterized protein n=1 Tax=Colocasia esculenta TaxID=4460 RepID=A0A843V2R1_COLES|nr:hypothetical protein [Colocasia esculenta]
MTVLCGPSSGTLVLRVCPGTVCTVEVYVVFLDTLTHVFDLYVRLRERRQRAATRLTVCLACNGVVADLYHQQLSCSHVSVSFAPSGCGSRADVDKREEGEELQCDPSVSNYLRAFVIN